MECTGIPRGERTIVRSFRHAQAAVSPVISTILMVAITVVLAATAFVLVAGIAGDTTDTAPPVGFFANDVEDRLEVRAPGAGADWDRIAILLADDGGSGSILLGNPSGVVNQEAQTGGLVITGRVDIVQTTTPMIADDRLYFCRSGGADGAVELEVIDYFANQRLGTYTFGGLEACP